jgi:predicted ABC-type ATPase
MTAFSKKLFVFAGPNGSGKSSVIRLFLEKNVCPAPYICPDNFVPKDKREDVNEYVKGMKKAEKIRLFLLKIGKSFTFETVFSTEEKFEFLKSAKERGYHISLIYITTADPQINIQRIEDRKKQGGHGVPTEKVLKRYEKSMTLLPEIICAVDRAEIYDNSGKNPILVFEKNNRGK